MSRVTKIQTGRVLGVLTVLCALGLAGLEVNADLEGKEAGVSVASGQQGGALSEHSKGLDEHLAMLPRTNGTNQSRGIAVDSSGNAYITGQWINSSGSNDFVTVKYNRSGKQTWMKRYSGPGNGDSTPTGVAVDSAGNAYVTGSSVGEQGGHHDFATIKYDSSGKQIWTKRLNGPGKGSDWAAGIAVDSKGNAYVTGDNEVSSNRWDLTTVKYDSSGKQIWTKRYNGPYKGSSNPSGIAVDSSGSVYVTGTSQSGEGLYDFATVKYDSSGRQIWSARNTRSGSDLNYTVGLSVNDDSVYVGGSTKEKNEVTDLTIVKYKRSNGSRLWTRYFNSGRGSDNPAQIAADKKGNAYLTGKTGDGDFLTVKYDSSGKLIWTRTYNGPAGGYDYARAIAVDSSGRIYITGQSTGQNMSTDFATIKYSPGGKTYWVQRFNGKGNGQDSPSAIAVDSSGSIYVTGQSQLGSGDNYGFATVKYDSSGKQTWVTYFSGQ